MRIIITLKNTDADGLGGDILMELGCKRRESNPCVFEAVHSFDPAIVAPPDTDGAQWGIKYADVLMDHGIKPRRIQLDNDRTHSLTPLFASAAGHISTAMKLLANAEAVREAASADDAQAAAVDVDSDEEPKGMKPKKNFLSIHTQPEKSDKGWTGKAVFMYQSGPKKNKKYRMDVHLDSEAALSVKNGQLLVEPPAPDTGDDAVSPDDEVVEDEEV